MLNYPRLTAGQKEEINSRFSNNGKIFCAVGKKQIEDKKSIMYHHINPITSFGDQGENSLSNLAPVCKSHHRKMRSLSINEFNAYLEMEDFFMTSDFRRLDDVIKLKSGGHFVKKTTKIETDDIDKTANLFILEDDRHVSVPLFVCPTTGYRFFYYSIPVEYVYNDSELQPRPLKMKRLLELYKNLLVYTQLTPSICRYSDGKILLFDGQHKTAAQIWAGRKEIECKVYLNPDLKVLKEANLIAHDKLRQMPFFTSVLINKWADLFNEEWDDYLDTPGTKSESGFISFLSKKGKNRTEALNMITSNIYDSIIEDKINSITPYLSEYNSTIKCPLTVNRLKQTIFKKFISKPPLNEDIERSDLLREVERKNNIKLLNIITDETLKDRWAPDKNDSTHQTAERFYLSGALKAWASILMDVISQNLGLLDENERKRIFLREIDSKKWEEIRIEVAQLYGHKIWSSNNQDYINNLRVNNEEHVRNFLFSKGLSVKWILRETQPNNNHILFID